MEDNKYVVFKIGDWLDQRQVINGVSNLPLNEEPAEDPRATLDKALKALDAARLDDAVVIRLQDLFAAGVLFTYAGAVQSAIEIMAAHNIAPPEDLLATRDHFFELASAAEASPIKKLPDHG